MAISLPLSFCNLTIWLTFQSSLPFTKKPFKQAIYCIQTQPVCNIHCFEYIPPCSVPVPSYCYTITLTPSHYHTITHTITPSHCSCRYPRTHCLTITLSHNTSSHTITLLLSLSNYNTITQISVLQHLDLPTHTHLRWDSHIPLQT